MPAFIARPAASLPLCQCIVELTIYINLFVYKPRPTGWRQTMYRKSDRRNVVPTPIVIGKHTETHRDIGVAKFAVSQPPLCEDKGTSMAAHGSFEISRNHQT